MGFLLAPRTPHINLKMARKYIRKQRVFRLPHFILTLVTLSLLAWRYHRSYTGHEHGDMDMDAYERRYALDRGYQHADAQEEEESLLEALGRTTDTNTQRIKTILMWTPFYENPDYYFGFGQHPFISNKCPVYNCETTRDKSRLNESDAVLLHGPRVEELEPLPVHRPPGQIYILFQTEPHYYPSVAFLPQYRDMFNYTMASRREADAFIAYGWVIPSRYGQKVRKGVVVDPTTKPKSVVWVVSHCDTHGHREWYVEELAKYIDVDVYGACGPLSCPIGDPCLDKFEMEYKFYLALENSYCKEYVTEKMYRTMTYDIVPIVFGGANYTLDAPPNSVINILDFPHPKDLAAYLQYLSTNTTAYDAYFEWKRHYVVQHFRHKIFGQAFCKLCEDLNNPDFVYNNYTDVANWWLTGLCDSEVIPRLRQNYNW